MGVGPRALACLALLAAACRAPAERDAGTWTDRFDVRREALRSTGRNPFFILEQGYRLVLEDRAERLVISVLPETRIVDGVETRVVEERETVGERTIEVSRNYYAIDPATGDVYYFGEDVDVYRNGQVVSHEGSWLAGVNGARFGLAMPGRPVAGARYYQEIAPGAAMDRAEIVRMDDSVLVVRESTPLEPMNREHKSYRRGVGLVEDGTLRLVRT